MEKITSRQMKIMDALREIENGRATDISKEVNLPWSSLERELNQLCKIGYVKCTDRIYSINTCKEYICGINITDEKTVIVIADLYFKIKEVITIESDENVYQTIDNAINKALEYIDEKTTKFSNIFITTAEDLDIIEDFLSWDMKDRFKVNNMNAYIIEPIKAVLSVTKTKKDIKSVAYVNSKGVRCATQIGNQRLISKKNKLDNKYCTISEFKDEKNIERIVNLFHNYLSIIGNDKLYVYSSEIVSSDFLTKMFYKSIEVNLLVGSCDNFEHELSQDTSDKLALGAAICGYYNTAIDNKKK